MNGAQPSQGQPGQQQQPQQQAQQRPQPKLFRPEQMRDLPDKFSLEEKTKWENGLRMLYQNMAENPSDSQKHRDAYKKIHDFSLTLMGKMQSSRPMNNTANQAPRPQAQGQPQQQGQQQPQQQSQGGNAPPSQPTQSSPGQPQQAPQRAVPNAQMRQHVETFPYVAPAGMTPGSKEAEAWIRNMRERYLKALMSMEQASVNIKRLDQIKAQRTADGKAFTPVEENEFKLKKDGLQRSHMEAKRFVETFRNQQAQQKQVNSGAAGQQGQQNQQPQNTQQTQQPSNPIAVPARPTMNLQQPASQSMPTTESVQAAMQAARQNQMNGGRPNVPQQNVPATHNASTEQSQPPQAPQQPGGMNAGLQTGIPLQGFQPQIKQEPAQQPHPINTNLPQAPGVVQQLQRTNTMNSPQSATPQSGIPQNAQNGVPVGPPKPLSHQDAVAQAQRTYSSSQTANTPNVMAASHSHPTPIQRDIPHLKTQPPMPIPKQLPAQSIGPPQPVQMPSSRPTYTGGPSGSGSGQMQQPVIPKAPGYVIEGDAERVLNKRKLDELVRQVTGGGESLNDADGLTPEVEDVSFTTSSLRSHVKY